MKAQISTDLSATHTDMQAWTEAAFAEDLLESDGDSELQIWEKHARAQNQSGPLKHHEKPRRSYKIGAGIANASLESPFKVFSELDESSDADKGGAGERNSSESICFNVVELSSYMQSNALTITTHHRTFSSIPYCYAEFSHAHVRWFARRAFILFAIKIAWTGCETVVSVYS